METSGSRMSPCWAASSTVRITRDRLFLDELNHMGVAAAEIALEGNDAFTHSADWSQFHYRATHVLGFIVVIRGGLRVCMIDGRDDGLLQRDIWVLEAIAVLKDGLRVYTR